VGQVINTLKLEITLLTWMLAPAPVDPGQYAPAKHATQSVETDLPVAPLYVPAAHGLTVLDPAGQYPPTKHATQSVETDLPVAVLNVPALQFTNVLLASGQ
jgi:hypothetical protein